jgi:drug/metabolite transporter (DMT)-like permease
MRKTFLLLHLAVLLAGFTGIFGKLIALNEMLLVWYRVLLTTIFMSAFFLVSKKFIQYKKTNVLTLLASGMLPGLHWIFFYGSIKYSNVSIGVVCFCLTGFFTALLSPLINNKKLSIVEFLLSALMLAGIGLIFHFDTSYRFGILLGIVSASFAALFTIANERLVKKYDSKMIIYYQMIGATIGIGLLLAVWLPFFPLQKLFPDAGDMVYLLMLSLFCTIGMYLIIIEVLKKISAFTVNLSFNLEPVYSIILAMIIFHENKVLTISFYAGVFLIMLSVVLQMVFVRRQLRA